MAAQEIPVAEKLTRLYELQKIDSQLDEITILKGELPMEVADLEDEIEGLATRINRLKTSLKESEADLARMQGTAKDATTKIAKYEKQLEEVKNNREYDALVKEIELAKLDIQLSEKRGKEFKIQLDTKKEQVTIAEARLESRQKDLVSKKAELATIIEKTEKEEEKLKKKTEKARKNIEERLLKAYDKIRKTYRNGRAVVTVERDACGGCYNKIPPQVQLEAALHKKIVACEHCGRILVDGQIAYADQLAAAAAATEE
jgi:uncharacterized protein